MEVLPKKITVITINYNNTVGLDKTIQSVISQTTSPLEYIIIDGGSSDKSLEIIKKYESRITYWVSEKDEGIYHAMNKGIIKATGEYLLFLNSGDYFADNNALEQMEKLPFNEDIIYWDQKNLVTSEIIKYPEVLSFYFFYTTTLNHQSTLIRRSLFEKNGYYNQQLKIVSDWEFYIKAIFLNHATYKKLPGRFTQFDYSDGISNHPHMYQQLLAERQIVLQKYFPQLIRDYDELEKYKRLRYKLSLGKRLNSAARRISRYLSASMKKNK